MQVLGGKPGSGLKKNSGQTRVKKIKVRSEKTSYYKITSKDCFRQLQSRQLQSRQLSFHSAKIVLKKYYRPLTVNQSNHSHVFLGTRMMQLTPDWRFFTEKYIARCSISMEDDVVCWISHLKMCIHFMEHGKFTFWKHSVINILFRNSMKIESLYQLKYKYCWLDSSLLPNTSSESNIAFSCLKYTFFVFLSTPISYLIFY